MRRRLRRREEARAWLRPFWQRIHTLEADDRQWLSLALMEATSGIGSDWLRDLERAWAAWPNDPAVAAAVGMAFTERQLWGKARAPLEQAAKATGLSAQARRRAWRLLAHLAEQEDDRRAHRRASAPPRASTDILRGFAAVAQLDRVLGYEPRGRGFDSCQPHHKNQRVSSLEGLARCHFTLPSEVLFDAIRARWRGSASSASGRNPFDLACGLAWVRAGIRCRR